MTRLCPASHPFFAFPAAVTVIGLFKLRVDALGRHDTFSCMVAFHSPADSPLIHFFYCLASRQLFEHRLTADRIGFTRKGFC